MCLCKFTFSLDSATLQLNINKEIFVHFLVVSKTYASTLTKSFNTRKRYGKIYVNLYPDKFSIATGNENGYLKN